MSFRFLLIVFVVLVSRPSDVVASVDGASCQVLGLKVKDRLKISCTDLCDRWSVGFSLTCQSPEMRNAFMRKVDELKVRALQYIDAGKIIVVDKAVLENRKSSEEAFTYNAETEAVGFEFPFSRWRNVDIVVVWDHRLSPPESFEDDYVEDFLAESLDDFNSLVAREFTGSLKPNDREAARVLEKVFGVFYSQYK